MPLESSPKPKLADCSFKRQWHLFQALSHFIMKMFILSDISHASEASLL